jgi:hypothetical protein
VKKKFKNFYRVDREYLTVVLEKFIKEVGDHRM